MANNPQQLPPTFNKDFHDEALCRQMEYRPLGAMQVSKISMGGATFSALFGELDVEEAIATIHEALRSGVNYIDTAPYYGQGRSEEVLGMALRDIPRDAYYIATKVGRYEKNYAEMFDFTAAKTRASVERSLKLLGLDYVDVIQIHDIDMAPNMDVIINECLPELECLVAEGKARFIGLTGYLLPRLREYIERLPERFQLVLSYARNTLLDNSLADYIEFFQQQKLGIVCAAVHALGLLTNTGPQPWSFASEELKAICRKAAAYCAERGIELGKLAMYHSVQLSGAATFLCGMQTRRVLAINMAAIRDDGLTMEEQEVLQHLRQSFFVNPMNWEGVEMQLLKAALEEAEQKKKKQ